MSIYKAKKKKGSNTYKVQGRDPVSFFKTLLLSDMFMVVCSFCGRPKIFESKHPITRMDFYLFVSMPKDLLYYDLIKKGGPAGFRCDTIQLEIEE